YEATAPRAAVLALHGWFDHAGRWRETGERLCAAGYSAYLLDLRGHGRSGGRPGHLSRFSQLLGDLQAFRRVVRIRTERPQVLLGLSFGGLVALRYLETQPSDPIAGAVLAGPWPGLAFRPRAWQLSARPRIRRRLEGQRAGPLVPGDVPRGAARPAARPGVR